MAGHPQHEREKNEADGAAWDYDERDFRAGFEAAVLPSNRLRSPEEAWVEAGRRYAELYNRRAFEKGFQRGRVCGNSLLNQQARTAKK